MVRSVCRLRVAAEVESFFPLGGSSWPLHSPSRITSPESSAAYHKKMQLPVRRQRNKRVAGALLLRLGVAWRHRPVSCATFQVSH
jgi:hypothetical protein